MDLSFTTVQRACSSPTAVELKSVTLLKKHIWNIYNIHSHISPIAIYYTLATAFSGAERIMSKLDLTNGFSSDLTCDSVTHRAAESDGKSPTPTPTP